MHTKNQRRNLRRRARRAGKDVSNHDQDDHVEIPTDSAPDSDRTAPTPGDQCGSCLDETLGAGLECCLGCGMAFSDCDIQDDSSRGTVAGIPTEVEDDFFDACSEADADDDDDDSVVYALACGDQDDEYTPEDDGMERGVDVTVDSGAGLPVASRKHFPGMKVTSSEGSRRGQKFMGPGGDLIPNRGQMQPQIIVESGDTGIMNFAEADVRKPLLAVSAINAKGSPVWFDGVDSFILPKSATKLPEIRDLIRQIKSKIRLHQSRGTYVMRTWRKPSGPFQGPGR